MIDITAAVTDASGNGAGPEIDFPLYDAADAETWDFPPPGFIVDRVLPLLGHGADRRAPQTGQIPLGAVPGARHRVSAREGRQPLRGAGLPEDLVRHPRGRRPASGALRFVIKPRIDLMNPEHVAWLRETCQHEGMTVLVLDTWTALSPAADPLSPKDQAQLAAVVVQLAEDIAGLVIVVDHSRKNRPEGSILSSADIFGAPQKWAAAEHVVMVDHAGGDANRWEIFVEGKDSDSVRFFLAKSARGSGEEKLVHAGDAEALGAESRALGNANRQAVLGALRALAKWSTTSDVVEVLTKTGRKLSPDTVQRHLGALLKGGAPIDQAGEGRSTRYRATATPQVASAATAGAANE